MPSAASVAAVTQDYTLELLRSGSTNDINSWASEIDAGLLTAAQVATAIGSSPEANMYALPVEQLYAGLFGRVGDAGGLKTWVNALQAGASLSSVVLAFVNSAEFAAKYGAPTSVNAIAFVTSLYTNILGRSPDSGGLSNWTGVLSTVNATNLATVVLGIITSAEAVKLDTGPIDAYLAAAGVSGTYAAQITGIPGPAGTVTTNNSFTLTTGTDTVSNYVNVYGSLTPFNINGQGPTLNVGDTISSVTNLYITDQNGAGGAVDMIPAGTNLSNITNIILTTIANAGIGAGTPFNTAPISGVASVTVNSSGAGVDWVNAAATTAIVDNQASQGAAAGVQTSGGSTVTVTSGGAAGVVVGNTATAGLPGVVPAAAGLPAGAVSVTENNSAGGFVGVLGGTTVTVNVTSATNTGAVNIGNTAANTGNSALGGATNPTGAITVTDASGAGTVGGVGAITVFGSGANGVTVTAASSNVTVGDVTGKLASNQPTGAVSVTDKVTNTYNNLNGAANNKVATGKVSIYGGSNITATSNTGSPIVIGKDSTVAGSLATGTISLTDSASDLNGAFAIGGFATLTNDTIVGGTNITATESGSGITIGSGAGNVVTNAADNASGTVTVTENVVSHQVVTIDGGVGITVTALGQAVNIGTNTTAGGAISVTDQTVLTGKGIGGGSAATAIVANGGTSVTVNTSGGNVVVGSAAVGNGTAQVASGAISITDTYSGSGTANGDAFTALGGTTVAITDANSTNGAVIVGAAPALNTAGTALKNANLDPTGNVTITNGSLGNFGSSVATIYTNGATTVTLTGAGTGNLIDDVNSFATGSGTAVGTSVLATVLLDGVIGTVGIDSNAITTLSVLDDTASTVAGALSTNVTIAKNAGGQAGFSTLPAHTLALTLNNDTAGQAGSTNAAAIVNDATATAVTVTTGTAAVTNLVTLTTAKANSFVFNNTAPVTVVGATMNGTANTTQTVTVSGTGAVNLGDTIPWAATKLTSVTTSDPAGVTVTINGDVTAFAGGSSGNNIVTLEDTTGLANTINGGSAGANTLIVTNAQSFYTGLLGGTIFNNVSNFATLQLGPNAAAGPDGQPGASGAYNVSGFTAVNIGQVAGALALTSAASAETLSIVANPGFNTAWTYAGAAPSSMSVTIGTAAGAFATGTTVRGVTTAGVTGGTLTIGAGSGTAGTPGITINSVGGAATGTVNTLTISDTGGVTANKLATITITGNEPLTLTDANAASIVNTINASAATGAVNVTGVVVAAAGSAITGGSGVLTASMNTENAPANTDVDSATTGSGGGIITLGAGGAGGAGAGSETVNLAASTAVRDQVLVNQAPIAANGTRATVSGFTSSVAGAVTSADLIAFQQAVTTYGPNANGVAGANGETYNVSNGVLSVATTGGQTLATQLTDAQSLIDRSGANTVGAITLGGNTYVIESAAQNAGANGTVVATDSIIQLSGVTGITGFANGVSSGGGAGTFVATGSGTTIATTGLTLLTAGNQGSAVANATFADTGFTVATQNAGAAAFTNTFNFGNFAQLNITGAVGAGNDVVTLTGAVPELLITPTGAATLTSLSYNGVLAIDATGAAITITTLTDTPGTDTTIFLAGGTPANGITIATLNDAGLTTINATNDTGSVTLGGTAALSQAGLTFLGGLTNGAASTMTITASGAGDTFTMNAKATAANFDNSVIVANGAGDTFNLARGANTLTANGAGDVIKVGVLTTAAAAIADAQTINANGVGDTITFQTAATNGAAITFTGVIAVSGGNGGASGIGLNDTVNFGNSTAGTETVTITGDFTGATTSGGTTTTGIAMTTLGNVTAANAAFDFLVLNNATGAGAETLAGGAGTLAGAEVNVASAGSLAQALDMAASYAALGSQAGGGNTPAGVMAPRTGIVDWFQYGGNTYVVEALNATAANATHAALATNDTVVKIVGLVDLSAGVLGGVGNHTLQL